MKPKVLLISTVHPPTDPRIAYKIAPSLADSYQVICALPNASDTCNADIQMIRLPHFRSLLFRIFFCHPVLLWKCLRLNPQVVHVFVPELIPIALLFQFFGATVIYEVQENLFKKFATKQYNNSFILQRIFGFFDKIARTRFYFIFTEDAYLQEYNCLKWKYTVVHNYASLSLIDENYQSKAPTSPPIFFYCGVISMERCLDIMLLAFAKVKTQIPDFRVFMFGPMRMEKEQIQQLPGYSEVAVNLKFYGYTDLKLAIRLAQGATAAIALLRPVADYQESYTTKLFEYMAMELPVVTSDFLLYRNVVVPAACGFCISPDDVAALTNTLLLLAKNPGLVVDMGKKGREHALKNYNWSNEEKILHGFYKDIVEN